MSALRAGYRLAPHGLSIEMPYALRMSAKGARVAAPDA
jgi:hypothetical protein